ncbi:AbrB/MazE/SpoVT family DNA-binding domain-containing protein [Candidatus Micrarchaeota archaeon]|nr:AbrB/MazE/SpoVT family DNA-binding domain-containing protein [Candidatus Micrarchaeota archaeon]
MVRLCQAKKTGQTLVTIPAAIVRAKGLKHGQEMEWIIDNLGQLILKPKP